MEKAHARTREVLKFSSLITDVYLHYTPSQIMLAALSMADSGMAEEMINGAFKPGHANGHDDASRNEAMTAEMRQKVTRNIQACRNILEEEPPERMETYWGSVRPGSNRLRGRKS